MLVSLTLPISLNVRPIRESGENPELSRSGKQERQPFLSTGSLKMSWEATASRKFFIACKSEDLSVAGVCCAEFCSSLRERGWMAPTHRTSQHTTETGRSVTAAVLDGGSMIR